MKKKQKVQIFKLEERVLFDGAAAAEIAAAVDQAAEQNQNQADDHSDNSEQGKEDKLIRNTVQNAGPVDTPDPAGTVQTQGEGLPQADAPRNDPAEVLINGNADFPQVTDPDAGFSGDVAEFIQSADPDAAAAEHELIVIDSEAADQFDQDAFEGKNVLFLDADSEAADQIEDWMNEHSDQDISEVRLVTDSDTLASQISDIDHLEVTAVDDFQSELADADSGDLVIVPDPEANITVDAPADELPEELSNAAAEGRHELVIVNSTMADLDNVLDQLGDSREVLVIDVNADAFEQISDYLDNSGTAYDAVHILTHGNAGGVVLGSQFVSDADPFAVFADHLSSGSDIMLYGCDMAATERGQLFIQNIADVTGADVAASSDITGSQFYNGNWTLEYSTGAIETANISLDSSWEHRLSAYTIGSVPGATNASLAELDGTAFVTGDTITYLEAMTDDITGSAFTFNGNLTLSSDYNVTIKGGSFAAGDVDNDLLIINGTGSFTVDGMSVTGNVDSSIDITVANNTFTAAGTLTMKGAHTLTLNADAEITTLQLNDGSAFANTAGVTLTGNVDSYTDIDIDNTLTITGTLTMRNGTTLNLNTDAAVGKVELENDSTFGYNHGVTLTGNIDYFISGIPLTLTDAHSLTITGTLTMESGTELDLQAANTQIGMVLLQPDSTFTYTGGVTLTGSVDSYIDVTLADPITITGNLTMESGTALALNTDVTIGTVVLESGSAFTYTGGVTLDGSVDSYIDVTLADPITITGNLTMEDGTALALNTDVTIGTVVLESGSAFTYTAGVTLYGGIDTYIDLTFDQAGTFTVRPFDSSTPSSAIILRAGAMTVNADSTLNLVDTVITVVNDSPAVTAIDNAGTVNFYGDNSIHFQNGLSEVYSGVVNTGTVNIVKDTTIADTAALTVNFSLLSTWFQKNGLLNNGANAVINITEGSLSVNTSANTAQQVYAINNTQGQTSGLGGVVITQGSTVTLTTRGRAGAALYNPKDQVATIGTADAVDGSKIIMTTPAANENYAVYNNGTLKIYNSHAAASGTGSIGLFNGTDGTVTFKVDFTPDAYLSESDIAYLASSADLVGDASKLVYSITGGAYSVYNQKSFTAVVPQLRYSGIIHDMEVKDIPVAALNGNVGNYAPASGSSPVLNLTNITINGNLNQSGNSKVYLTDVALNGNLTNDRGNVFISGYFGNSGELSVGDNTASYLNGIVIQNDYDRFNFPGAFGNVYIGTDAAVTFNSLQSYSFINLAGKMFIYNFTDLSSEANPIEIYNAGIFKMESENPYDLYVTGANYAAYLNSADYNTPSAAGISDAGILNFNRNTYAEDSIYSQYYPVENNMVLTNLNIRNMQNSAAAVTNYAGVLTITGGSLQASYSGIDLLNEVLMASKNTTTFEFTVMTPVTTLTDLTKIAGGAYSIRNTGELTMTSENVEGGTLLTNKADFSVSYSGDYVALGNYSMTFTVRERYDSSTGVMNHFQLTARSGVQNFSRSWDAASQSASPLTPAQFSAYSVSGDDITTRSEIEMSDTPDLTVIVNASNPTINDFYFSGYGAPAVGSVTGVAFQVAAGTGTKTAIQNWGDLTVSEINDGSDYRFTGFTVSIDNGRTTFWDSQNASISHFTIKGDYTIGFDLPASQVLTAPYASRSSMTLRGVETGESGIYVGRLMVDGGRYVVYTTQALTLENFSVTAADSDAILNAGTLLIFNGTGSETTGWTGPSNAVITATGHAAIVNEGRVRMINGAIRDSGVGIQQESSGLLSVINSTLYNNGTGIVSSLGAPSGDGMNFEVIDTTIVSAKENSIGIQLNVKGQLDLVNTIILVQGYKGLVNEVGAKVDAHSSTNIYGTGEDDTLKKMNEVYGTDFNGIDGSYDLDLNVLYLASGSTALSGGVAVGYTVSESGVYEFLFGGDASSAAVKVTEDKGGNTRGEAIGSYVLTGTPTPTVTVIVNTLHDAFDVDNGIYSLRYVIDWLQGSENKKGDTAVAFDWDKIYAEAGVTVTSLVFELSSGSVAIAGDNAAKITELLIDVSGVDSNHTVTIGNDGMTASLFTISGMAVTVKGTSAETFTVDGSGATGVSSAANGAAFNLADEEGTSLTLQKVTVTGGNTTGDGGAVYVGGANASLTATETTFSNNIAANGGAIYNNGGTITVDGTLSGNNAAGDGGAVYNASGTATISASMSDNHASANGGALYNAGTAEVTGDITVSSAMNGAGIYNTGTLTAGALSSNTATVNGGALYNIGTATITGDISGNWAVDGAGIYNTGTLTAGALSDNQATGNGGALYNTGTATITGDISGNRAADGAGVYSINELIVNGNNVNLSGNIASNNGGALFNAGTAVITGDITGNSAANGAGIYMIAGNVTLNGGLSGNTATGEGAALYIAGGKFSTNGNVTDNTGASIICAAGGRVQFGSLDHYYVTMSGNTGILVNEEGGDVLIVNASITENVAGAESLFAISDGVFTTLNTTITANSGDVLDQTGGTVQIGDTTIYEPDGAVSITGGYLYVLNSIVNVSNDFTVTNDEGSRINEDKSRIFVLKGGEPVSGPNGTLQIKLAGKAGRDGVMLGYTQDAVKTMLYYTSDGSTWHDAAGSVSAAAPAFEVEYSQNESERLYNGYAFLSIGAYSLKATELSLVVTISGDEPVDGETTLREALEYAEYLYLTEGTVATVTFLVSDVYLTSTITIDNPVTVSGGVTIHSTDLGPSPLTFAGDSVFVVNSADPEVKFQNLTIEGQTGVRGIRVDDGSVVLKNVTIENGQADGSKGSPARGGAIYVTGGGSVTGKNVILRSNLAEDGAAIYSNGPVELDGFTVTGNVQTGAVGGVIHVTDAASTLLLRNGTLTGNDTAGSLIRTAGAAELISVSAADNGVNDTVGSSLLKAASADIVNSTIAGNTADASALVAVTDDLNAVNSIIVTSRGSGQAVTAGSVKSAYSIYSGTLENVVVDVNNLTGSTFNALFSDNEGGRPVPREDSPAAVGVWTMYDPETREIAYSERPEDIWTVKYKPENMQWHVLGGGLTSCNNAYLVSGSSSMPSIGANWIQGGQNHPDYGPGVNTDMINPSFTGDYGLYWDYNSLVSGYYMNPYSSLTLDSETGMGWYSSLLSDLFGIRSQQSRILSVTGGIPSDELELSVDADMEDFGEFQEAPYSAEDGTPLSQEELNAIRNAAVTGRMPDDSVHLDEAVHEKVAASLRSSELFKDRFDKALDALLGLDA